MCKKQTSVSNSSTEAELISLLMQVYARRQYQLLIFGIWSWKSFILLQSNQRKPKIKHEETRRVTPHQTSTQTKDPTKHNNLELSDVDYVWSNKKSSLFGVMLYIFAENEAVIEDDNKRPKSHKETCIKNLPSCFGLVV